MPATIAPSDEACAALVTRINAGTAYTLPAAAAYYYDRSDDVQRLHNLTVDVIHVDEMDMQDTLDVEGRTSHNIEVWIRKYVPGAVTTAEVAAIKLIARQIFQQLNNWRSGRVSVWDAGATQLQAPDKAVLREAGVVSQVITLRVEVEASA